MESFWNIVDTYYIAYFCGFATMWWVQVGIKAGNKRIAKKKAAAEAAEQLKS